MTTYSIRLCALALLLVSTLTWLTPVGAEFHVREVRIRNDGDMLVMDADIGYVFSEDAIEALDNGVPLTLEVHVQLRAVGDWIWNESLVDQRLRYVIRYKPLSERYMVSRLPGEGGNSYVTRDAAIAAVGKIEGLNLISKERLPEAGKGFALYVKAFLDIEELPLPLRPIAYLFPSWKLSTGWTRWPLEL